MVKSKAFGLMKCGTFHYFQGRIEYEGTAEYYVNVMGVKDSIENIVERINTILYEQYANHITLKEGVKDYIEKLYSQNATKVNYNTFAVEDRQSKEVLEQLKATAKKYVHSFKQF